MAGWTPALVSAHSGQRILWESYTSQFKMVKLTPGVEYWKDDTNTLEFASSHLAAEVNLKEGKHAHFQEMRVKTLMRIFQDDCSAIFSGRRLDAKEGKLHSQPKWMQHEYVTLDDVKYAALLLKKENDSHHMLSFSEVMRNKKLDEFLMALLFYLSLYLEKIALEKKHRSLISTLIVTEEEEMDNMSAKLVVARIRLAKVYGNLILEQGMAQQLHVPGGKRKTSLQKDRRFFEGFYNFCSRVAWLVFRRKHLVIREEIGRLLCSNVFNPALRDRSNTDWQKAGHQTSDASTIRLPHLRKVGAKHPSIYSMVHQHSPLLNVLLPLPKDGAQHPSLNSPPRTPDSLPDFSELFTTKVGIIGAHCSELKSLMSMPDGTMEDEEEEEQEEQGRMGSGVSIQTNYLSLPPLRSPQNRLSDQSTVLSRAVVEGDCNQRN
ncbi:LOW QUALITY PROTEIN: protein phosphatase 1 regulatory subunit 36 [Porphyrio hochstetteri]